MARVQRGGSDVWLRGAELCFANGVSSPLKAFKTAKKQDHTRCEVDGGACDCEGFVAADGGAQQI